jgi:hypothetical protein
MLLFYLQSSFIALELIFWNAFFKFFFSWKKLRNVFSDFFSKFELENFGKTRSKITNFV